MTECQRLVMLPHNNTRDPPWAFLFKSDMNMIHVLQSSLRAWSIGRALQISETVAVRGFMKGDAWADCKRGAAPRRLVNVTLLIVFFCSTYIEVFFSFFRTPADDGDVPTMSRHLIFVGHRTTHGTDYVDTVISLFYSFATQFPDIRAIVSGCSVWLWMSRKSKAECASAAPQRHPCRARYRKIGIPVIHPAKLVFLSNPRRLIIQITVLFLISWRTVVMAIQSAVSLL